MAKPIEPTPILRGKDANRFISSMLNEERRPNADRVKFIKEAQKDAAALLKNSKAKCFL